MARVLGIDYGTKKIGFAFSDQEGRIAFPKSVQPNVWSYVSAYVSDLILKDDVSEIVLGLPVGLDGEETELSAQVRKFADKLKEEFALPIYFENEVYSTAQARTLEGSAEEKIDAASAALILQTFLDRRGRQND